MADGEACAPCEQNLMPPPPPPGPLPCKTGKKRRVMEPSRLTTADIVNTYVQQALSKIGYAGNAVLLDHCLDKTTKTVGSQTMTVLLEMENAFRLHEDSGQFQHAVMSLVFQPIVSQVPRVRDETGCSNYANAMSHSYFSQENITDPNYSWTAVAGVLISTADCAVHAAQSTTQTENPQMIRKLIDWCIKFFKAWHINEWIESKGGWESVVEDRQQGLHVLSQKFIASQALASSTKRDQSEAGPSQPPQQS